jgi:hypothetical protein
VRPIVSPGNNCRGNRPEDIAKIEDMCGKTYANSLIEVMKARDPNTELRWEWEKSSSPPKLISFLSFPILKDQPESDVIQAVIRFHGREVSLDLVNLSDN